MKSSPEMTSYKLATFASEDGARAGLVTGNRLVDIGKTTGNGAHRTVLELLSDWDASHATLRTIAHQSAATGMPLSDARLLAPLPVPGTIFCAGANYADHAAEMARRRGHEPPPDPHTLGLRSWHFIKASRCVAGPDETIPLPRTSKKVDWEAELAVVIGRRAKDVPEAQALAYVAGYTIANDLSARDLSRREGLPETSSFKNDWVGQKCFDGACPLGPWIVPAEDIPDPHDLAIELSVNGAVKQSSNTGQMIFSINEQIADLSARMTLWPGDVILTGTPAGVGSARGEFLKSGDVIRIRIDRIGELTNRIA
jgi:2-keto-4-pentenoate hydratase/2-oxohepta-3-ene-1,7-dioic acid hydratase in catechol pathway